MGFYEETGTLIFGTRLKRLSEKFLSEVGIIYERLGFSFEPAWFPMVFLIYKKGPLTITEISTELKVSQPAASQLVSVLCSKNYFNLLPDKHDKRKKLVNFSEYGQLMINKLIPIWEILENKMFDIICDDGNCVHLIESFNELEKKLSAVSLSDSVINKLKIDIEDNL